ncbi:transglutaminase family protein [Diaminobutyricibacter sp. McL0618]|uniref:transglutaminase family protein n=1 Tax=Leifsonia sp. McL0618 TaxID=3415677 RepID=UPI003CF1940B
MKRLRITHSTGYRYEGEVTASYNEARMLPISAERQLVLHSNLEVDPVSSHHQYTDYWGTRVLAFDVLAPHTTLTLSASSLVEVLDPPRHGDGLPWDELRRVRFTAGEYVQQLPQTALTEPADEVAGIAATVVGLTQTPCEAAIEICRRVGEEVEYVTGVTGVTSTAADAWAARKGVCQDITHIAVGALRSVGIPARYVSGYLHPSPDAVVGETVVGESHAWVEWFCGSWHGFDPTNQLEIGDRHVRVGHGRDYTDVAPLRGVYAGPTASELFVTVEITREA